MEIIQKYKLERYDDNVNDMTIIRYIFTFIENY